MYKRGFAYLLFISFLSVFVLTGCDDKVDIILTEAESTIPLIFETVPNEITTGTSNTATDDIYYAKTDITSVDNFYETSASAEIQPRPSLEEEFKFFKNLAADITFEPVEETEETKLAKQYMEGIWKACGLRLDTWLSPILDEYIDNGYLKNYIEFKFKMWYEETNITDYIVPFCDIALIEAVEQKQAGDITYVYVKGIVQYYSYGEWSSSLKKDWVGIRNGKVVDDGFFVGEDEYDLIGIEKTEKNKYGEPIYPFPPERNPWDNIDDIKKIYDGLKVQGYDIEMKEYLQPNRSIKR